VEEKFVELLKALNAQRSNPLTVVHGPTCRTPKFTQQPIIKTKVNPLQPTQNYRDPLTEVFEYMKKRSLRVIDLFKIWDRDRNEVLSREEVRMAFKV